MTRLLGLAALLPGTSVACGEGEGTSPELPPIIQHWDDWDPAWSPDGSQIAVRSNRATRHVLVEDPRSVVYDGHNDLFVLDTLGNAVQLTGDPVPQPPFYESPDVEYPSWSPDGRIAFSSGDTLWVVERDGSGLREVLIYEPALSLQDVAWSPAGGKIAFSWTTGCSATGGCTPRRIGVLDIDTDSLEVLTDPTLSSSSPSWSPDGSQLFYVFRPETGSPLVNRMNVDGTGATTLFPVPSNGYDLAWSPCGDQIAFSQTVAPRTHQLSLMDPDGTNVQVLTEGEQASWSPDCSKLAFIRAFVDEDGYEGIDVWTIHADGSEERRATRRD